MHSHFLSDYSAADWMRTVEEGCDWVSEVPLYNLPPIVPLPFPSVSTAVSTCIRDDDLSDLVIAESSRDDFIEHYNIFLEYGKQFEEDECRAWLQRLSDQRNISLRCLTVVPVRGKTFAFVSWNRKMRSKSRRILDHLGYHPVMRRVQCDTSVERVERYMDRLRAKTGGIVKTQLTARTKGCPRIRVLRK